MSTYKNIVLRLTAQHICALEEACEASGAAPATVILARLRRMLGLPNPPAKVSDRVGIRLTRKENEALVKFAQSHSQNHSEVIRAAIMMDY